MQLPTQAQGGARLAQPKAPYVGLASALLLLALTAMTWRGWASPIVDYGRELYAAWRIGQGDVLYRDIAWFNGPLSAWWNGFWFARLGAHSLVLVCVNLVLIALGAALIARLLTRAFDRTAAAVGVPIFLIMFALAHPLGIGNYNFVAPYSHELVHGALLGLALLVVGDNWVRSSKLAWAACLGLLLGAAFLTKPETFSINLFLVPLSLSFHFKEIITIYIQVR